MESYKNETIVYRNETWTLNKKIQNRDNSPYIVSKELHNPFWLITISSSRYPQENRYVLNKWLDISNTLRFSYTKPLNLKDFGYNSFDEIDGPPAGYEGDNQDYANVAVFYLKTANDVKYKYYDYVDNSWKDYHCNIITQYSKEYTSQWSEKNYFLGILLVSGTSLLDYLKSTCEKLGISVINDVKYLYNIIEKNDPSLLQDIEDINKPLINYDTIYPILEPERLLVQSNLKGAM